MTCPGCGVRHWRNPKPCAGGLVTRDGRLLLLRRSIEPWRGRWDIPGGFCDADEHPEATVIREVREETGLEVRVTGMLGIWMDTYGDGPEPEVTMNCYYHAVPIDGREPVADPAEASAAAFFAPHELPAGIAFPAHAGQVLAAWREAVAASGAGNAAGA